MDYLNGRVVIPPELNFTEDMIGDIVIRHYMDGRQPAIETGRYIKTEEMIMGYPVYVWQKDTE